MCLIFGLQIETTPVIILLWYLRLLISYDTIISNKNLELKPSS